jgi:hypothetical protein
MFTDDELIKKKDSFDPIEDDDDIDWKHNPFDIYSIEGSDETPEQLMSQTKLKALVREFIDVFVIDEDKWRLP